VERDAFAPLVPELMCRDPAASRAFYVDLVGFSIRYERPESDFVFLDLEGAQIMLCPIHDDWVTGTMEAPLGRGINLQIEVSDVDALRDRIVAAGRALFQDMETSWYRDGATEHGQREFLVQDPDGYLLRFCQDLGTRPIRSGAVSRA
jgi:catechol 2,3-dioxygenase-like lactoylglutathione lyase family enzyme